MKPTINALPRMAAMSVIVTILAAPLAYAQTPAPAAPSTVARRAQFLRADSFTRVTAQPQTNRDQVPVVPHLARLIQPSQPASALHRPGPAGFPLQSQGSQKSWASRHKVLTTVLIAVGATAGLMFIAYGAGWGDWGE